MNGRLPASCCVALNMDFKEMSAIGLNDSALPGAPSAKRNRKLSLLDRLALTAIDFYRRKISPRKKYRCAHAALHQGLTCSAAARALILDLGVIKALLPIHARLKECAKAHKELFRERVSGKLQNPMPEWSSESPEDRGGEGPAPCTVKDAAWCVSAMPCRFPF